ncbi:D-malate degradation protein R [Delftia tsuruhatensis]|nr:D-malate degradation protein R [Delftia tsuruhatensis]CAC9675800.1 D-malate degradation protein R [Delftia tsuruhatensis]
MREANNAVMDLNLCRVFIDIAEAGSLTGAAQRSGMTRSNVSRRLKALESEMGTQLLRRNTRSVELTQAGRLLYQSCLAMMRELQSARNAIHQLRSTVSGEVGVRVPTGFGHFYLKPLILSFCREHPDIRLRLLINDQLGDLVASKVDLAVQITSSPLDDLVATKLCEVRWHFVATPACLQALAGPLREAADLAHARLILPLAMGSRLAFHTQGGAAAGSMEVSPSLQSGDYRLLYEAVTAGQGLALLPHYVTAGAIADGRLVPVLEHVDFPGLGNAMYLVRMPDRQPTMAARTFQQFLREAIVSAVPCWLPGDDKGDDKGKA